jgi:succinate dehydrogenase/fumarate reductase flavoprotein subunit
MNDLDRLMSDNKKRTESLKKALETIYPIRERLQKALVETQSDELLDKIIELNKVISNAEAVIKMDSKESAEKYAQEHPQNVDENKVINEKGIKRMNFLQKKWTSLGFLNNNSTNI